MRAPWSAPAPSTAPGFEAFVAARRGPMLALARGLVASEADAEDLVQDVLARALLRWDRVSGADEPDAYANRMLINAARSLFRSARWRRERALPDE